MITLVHTSEGKLEQYVKPPKEPKPRRHKYDLAPPVENEERHVDLWLGRGHWIRPEDVEQHRQILRRLFRRARALNCEVNFVYRTRGYWRAEVHYLDNRIRRRGRNRWWCRDISGVWKTGP